MSSDSKPTHEFELVTPEVAEELLKKNPYNRNPRRLRINKYARAMDLGDWGLTGQPIIIDTDGNLMDGQHRLMAVVQTGQSIEFLVVRGVNRELMPLIDRGAARDAADALTWADCQHASMAAAALRQLLVLIGQKSTRDTKELSLITDQEVLDAYSDHESLIAWAAPMAKQVNVAVKISPARYLTAMLWMLVNGCDPDDVQAFTNQLISGADLPEGSPILALRNWGLTSKATNRKVRINEVLIAVIKTWNDVREGRSRKLMKIKPDETVPALVID